MSRDSRKRIKTLRETYYRKYTKEKYSTRQLFGRPDIKKVELDKPVFYGIQYVLVPKEWAKRVAGIEEAVGAATECVRFSGYDTRLCNLKRFESKISGDYDNAIGRLFGGGKVYSKRNLIFRPINEHEYNILSKQAKRLFYRVTGGLTWDGRPIIHYYLRLPAGMMMVKEKCQKVYIINAPWPIIHEYDAPPKEMGSEYLGEMRYFGKNHGRRSFWDRKGKYIRRKKRERFDMADISNQVYELAEGNSCS